MQTIYRNPERYKELLEERWSTDLVNYVSRLLELLRLYGDPKKPIEVTIQHNNLVEIDHCYITYRVGKPQVVDPLKYKTLPGKYAVGYFSDLRNLKGSKVLSVSALAKLIKELHP